MSVGSKSPNSARRRPARSKTKVKAFGNPGVISSSKAQDLPSRSSSSDGQIPTLHSSRSTPSWLRTLYVSQRRSSVIMFLLIAAMLTIYGWTVYSQKMWNELYRGLKNLQRHERQLTTTNEILKNQMASQAEKPDTELVPTNPAAAIFLPQAPQNLDSGADKSNAADTNTQKPITPTPLGY